MADNNVGPAEPFSLSADVQKSQLMTESWYHGGISRPISEGLMKNDGDFMVRESQGTPGQYVLSGMQSTSPKHLLLIDPEGIVRRDYIVCLLRTVIEKVLLCFRCGPRTEFLKASVI